jgi:hypothetical protein
VPKLSSNCVYTTRDSRILRQQFEVGGSHALTEAKAWTGGSKLFQAATARGELVPLILSDAETLDRFSGSADTRMLLVFWAVIEAIETKRNWARCRYRDLHAIDPPKPLSTLTLTRQGRPLSDDYRRNYALVRTPAFVDL